MTDTPKPQAPCAWQDLVRRANPKNLNRAFAFSTAQVTDGKKTGVAFTVWGLSQGPEPRPVALEVGGDLSALFSKYGIVGGCALETVK